MGCYWSFNNKFASELAKNETEIEVKKGKIRERVIVREFLGLRGLWGVRTSS